MLIPVEIDNRELLVRFIFTDDFRKKNVSIERLIQGEVYMDTRGTGVSLQRGNYTTIRFCSKATSKIPKQFAGFILFLKQNYLDACSSMVQIRPDFNSTLKFTPLDENDEYINDIENIDTEQPGNPSHADIFYIEPTLMMNPEEQTPNVALRLFSKLLCGQSKIYIATNESMNMEDDLSVLYRNMSENLKSDDEKK